MTTTLLKCGRLWCHVCGEVIPRGVTAATHAAHDCRPHPNGPIPAPLDPADGAPAVDPYTR